MTYSNDNDIYTQKRFEWNLWAKNFMYKCIGTTSMDKNYITFYNKTNNLGPVVFKWEENHFKRLHPLMECYEFELFSYYEVVNRDTRIQFKYKGAIYEFILTPHKNKIRVDLFQYIMLSGKWEFKTIDLTNNELNQEIKKMSGVIEYYLFKVDTNRVERLVDGTTLSFDEQLTII